MLKTKGNGSGNGASILPDGGSTWREFTGSTRHALTISEAISDLNSKTSVAAMAKVHMLKLQFNPSELATISKGVRETHLCVAIALSPKTIAEEIALEMAELDRNSFFTMRDRIRDGTPASFRPALAAALLELSEASEYSSLMKDFAASLRSI